MTAEVRSLNGSTVIVTGASSGIGRAVARQTADAGANVVLSGRRVDRLNELAAELGHDRAAVVQGDVRNAGHARELASSAKERFGRIDSLIASAGIGMYGGILDHTDSELREMVETNLEGTIWPIRSVVPEMLIGGGGDIVIIASVAGLRGGPHEAVYAATKSGQIGLAGAVDRELREHGIRVTAICPAAVATEFAMGEGQGRNPDMPELTDWLRDDDVAAAVVTVLKQPRRMRTTLWSMWSAVEGG